MALVKDVADSSASHGASFHFSWSKSSRNNEDIMIDEVRIEERVVQ